MRTDEPEGPVNDLVIVSCAECFEFLRGHAGPLDAHQFIYLGLVLSEHPQPAFVYTCWQDMVEWHFRAHFAPADLLVSAERHLPGRESEKYDSVLFQIEAQACEKCILAFGFDMFNDIVDQHDIEFVFSFERIGFQEVSA